jgi:hypothetical protein
MDPTHDHGHTSDRPDDAAGTLQGGAAMPQHDTRTPANSSGTASDPAQTRAAKGLPPTLAMLLNVMEFSTCF